MPNKGKYGKYLKHCTSCVYCINGNDGWLYCRYRDSRFTTSKGVCEKHIDTRSKEGKRLLTKNKYLKQ